MSGAPSRWRWKDVVTTAVAGGAVVLLVDLAFRVTGLSNDVTRAVAIGLGIGAARLLDRRSAA